MWIRRPWVGRGADGVVTHLALSSFLEVAARSGKSRVTKVRNIKSSEPYSPATDFYKPLRERIVTLHKTGKPISALSAILAGVSDARKASNYPAAISGYRTWWGSRTLTWFDPPRGTYSKHGFEISVNPELGLEFNGRPHVIKLYLKTAILSPANAQLIGALMQHVLGGALPTALFGPLDARRSVFIPAGPGGISLLSSVDSVLKDVAAIWPTV